MKQESEEKDWVKVLYEVILKILTLGFYHIEEQKNTAGGKKTWKSYLWKVCGEAYDQQHNG